MIDRVRLLATQTRLIDAIDMRYEVSLMSWGVPARMMLKVSLPLQPSAWKQLSVDAAQALLANDKLLLEFLADLERNQIERTLELLRFVNGASIGTGEMALKAKGYSRAGSDVRVRLFNGPSAMKGPARPFKHAVITKGSFRETAKTAEELLNALSKCGA